jgi:hypothetical protein
MRTLWLVAGSLLLGFVLGAGLTYQIKNAQTEPLTRVRGVDYFVTDESFSEVHNAKAVLAGLSRRFLTELRVSAWAKQGTHGMKMSSGTTLIQALEHGIDEFRGTENELSLIPDLLRALKSEDQCDRWLQTYLTLLYTHPTDELVVKFARDAVQMGNRTGRQIEVAAALRHVCNIPMEFPSKKDLHSMVLQLLPVPNIVSADSYEKLVAANPRKLSTLQ